MAKRQQRPAVQPASARPDDLPPQAVWPTRVPMQETPIVTVDHTHLAPADDGRPAGVDPKARWPPKYTVPATTTRTQ